MGRSGRPINEGASLLSVSAASHAYYCAVLLHHPACQFLGLDCVPCPASSLATGQRPMMVGENSLGTVGQASDESLVRIAKNHVTRQAGDMEKISEILKPDQKPKS